MKNRALTYEQQTELAGYYDNLASFFGGDELTPIEKVCDGRFNTNYFSIIRKLSKQLDRVLQTTSFDLIIAYNNDKVNPTKTLGKKLERWSITEGWKIKK